MTNPVNANAELPCFKCGYDLCAHPADGNCPECNASVAESKRVAAIPRRPRWQNSDPRWRRRMLAGAWLLVFMPLIAALQAWQIRVPMRSVFDFRATITLFEDTFIIGLFAPTLFCMGTALICSRELGRRRGMFDWTRRWGVLCSYIVFVIEATSLLFIASLVGVGISALFISMPADGQPGITEPFLLLSANWLRYGPHPTQAAYIFQIITASVLMLLACAPLSDALRSSGPSRLALIVLSPLAFFACAQLVQVAVWVIYPGPSFDFACHIYFSPETWIEPLGTNRRRQYGTGGFSVELAKWCCVLAIAIWLTIAQIKSCRVLSKRRLNEHSVVDAHG